MQRRREHGVPPPVPTRDNGPPGMIHGLPGHVDGTGAG